MVLGCFDNNDAYRGAYSFLMFGRLSDYYIKIDSRGVSKLCTLTYSGSCYCEQFCLRVRVSQTKFLSALWCLVPKYVLLF